MKLFITWKLTDHHYTMTCNIDNYETEENTKKSLIIWIYENKEKIIDWSFKDMSNCQYGHRHRFEMLIKKMLV